MCPTNNDQTVCEVPITSYRDSMIQNRRFRLHLCNRNKARILVALYRANLAPSSANELKDDRETAIMEGLYKSCNLDNPYEPLKLRDIIYKRFLQIVPGLIHEARAAGAVLQNAEGKLHWDMYGGQFIFDNEEQTLKWWQHIRGHGTEDAPAQQDHHNTASKTSFPAATHMSLPASEEDEAKAGVDALLAAIGTDLPPSCDATRFPFPRTLRSSRLGLGLAIVTTSTPKSRDSATDMDLALLNPRSRSQFPDSKGKAPERYARDCSMTSLAAELAQEIMSTPTRPGRDAARSGPPLAIECHIASEEALNLRSRSSVVDISSPVGTRPQASASTPNTPVHSRIMSGLSFRTPQAVGMSAVPSHPSDRADLFFGRAADMTPVSPVMQPVLEDVQDNGERLSSRPSPRLSQSPFLSEFGHAIASSPTVSSGHVSPDATTPPRVDRLEAEEQPAIQSPSTSILREKPVFGWAPRPEKTPEKQYEPQPTKHRVAQHELQHKEEKGGAPAENNRHFPSRPPGPDKPPLPVKSDQPLELDNQVTRRTSAQAVFNFTLASIEATAEAAMLELKHHTAEVDRLTKEIERLETMRASLTAADTLPGGDDGKA